jgi:hypothetical protein
VNVTSAADSVARGCVRVRSPDIRRCAQLGWVSALGACRLTKGRCGASLDRASVRRRGIRRSDLGRTDGTADAEKQPTGLTGLASAGQWGGQSRVASTDLGRVEGGATQRHKRCPDTTPGATWRQAQRWPLSDGRSSRGDERSRIPHRHGPSCAPRCPRAARAPTRWDVSSRSRRGSRSTCTAAEGGSGGGRRCAGPKAPPITRFAFALL